MLRPGSSLACRSGRPPGMDSAAEVRCRCRREGRRTAMTSVGCRACEAVLFCRILMEAGLINEPAAGGTRKDSGASARLPTVARRPPPPALSREKSPALPPPSRLLALLPPHPSSRLNSSRMPRRSTRRIMSFLRAPLAFTRPSGNL